MPWKKKGTKREKNALHQHKGGGGREEVNPEGEGEDMGKKKGEEQWDTNPCWEKRKKLLLL